jgi:hypothetical protein
LRGGSASASDGAAGYLNMEPRITTAPAPPPAAPASAPTTSRGICPDCAEALRVERAAALDERCRIHRVRYVDDLPVSVLQEMRAERGRC